MEPKHGVQRESIWPPPNFCRTSASEYPDEFTRQHKRFGVKILVLHKQVDVVGAEFGYFGFYDLTLLGRDMAPGSKLLNFRRSLACFRCFLL